MENTESPHDIDDPSNSTDLFEYETELITESPADIYWDSLEDDYGDGYDDWFV